MIDNKVITDNSNFIQQMAVCELMNDRYFYIPSYQRGYRWGKTQIYDLCNDLLDYVLKKEKDAKNKSFYCLQPIIVIPRKFEIKGHDYEGFEVVDGQQRLTSLFILYRFLVSYVGHLMQLPIPRAEKIKDIESKHNTQLYHLYYETRPNDFETIEKIGLETLLNNDIMDIDIAHISNAYQYINNWLKDAEEGAWRILKRYPKSEIQSANKIVQGLLDILHNKRDSEKGSVQVIWYQLNEEKDAVKEFIKENTGKIKLTDTELIKGLFLQKRNWGKELANLQQLSIGKDWELIENTLHNNEFWAFLSNDIHQEDNRIEIVFKYIYQKHNNGNSLPKDSKNALFRFYSDYFEENFNKGGMSRLWDEVKECFQAMQNWYNDPYIYNLVGLLSKNGKTLYDIITIYESQDVVTKEDFLWKLKKEIKNLLPKPIESDDQESKFPKRLFKLFYAKDDNAIRNLLRFVNVRQKCLQIDKARHDIESGEKKSDKDRSEKDLMSQIYRFPYDVMESFSWDVEHIDSATTNQLNAKEEKEIWIKESKEALGDKITKNQSFIDYEIDLNTCDSDDDRTKILNNMISIIKSVAEDGFNEDSEEAKDRKNWIGNLTLLDCGTNRQYKNAIFAIKHNKIAQRVRDGIFVPICTKKVFDKQILGCTDGLWRWDWNDKLKHHDFLLKEYDAFVKEINDYQAAKNINNYGNK